MNEIIQNRALRGFLTIFVGFMLTLSIGLAMRSIYPQPETGYFDWYAHGGAAWEEAHPAPSGDGADMQRWEEQRATAEAKAARAWEATQAGARAKLTTWSIVTFLVLFALGAFLVVGSTLWQERLAVLSGGLFLAGVLLLGDAALVNFGFAPLFEQSGETFFEWTLVAFALVGAVSIASAGWWRFTHLCVELKDGRRAFTLLAALAPVYALGITVFKVLRAANVTDSSTQSLWFCVTFFVSAALLLSLGMTFSRKLGLLGNVFTLSAVIMAFASVIATLGFENVGITSIVALAATIVAMFVGFRTFAKRAEEVVTVEPTGVAVMGDSAPSDRVLVLHAVDNPPSDAVMMEVPLGNGVVYRGFASYREK